MTESKVLSHEKERITGQDMLYLTVLQVVRRKSDLCDDYWSVHCSKTPGLKCGL